VLWGGTYGLRDSYGAYQAFESKRECVAARKIEIEKAHPANRAGAASYYSCWPVGVDPTRVANPTVDT
jgi:hypothetical protein